MFFWMILLRENFPAALTYLSTFLVDHVCKYYYLELPGRIIPYLGAYLDELIEYHAQ